MCSGLYYRRNVSFDRNNSRRCKRRRLLGDYATNEKYYTVDLREEADDAEGVADETTEATVVTETEATETTENAEVVETETETEEVETETVETEETEEDSEVVADDAKAEEETEEMISERSS